MFKRALIFLLVDFLGEIMNDSRRAHESQLNSKQTT